MKRNNKAIISLVSALILSCQQGAAMGSVWAHGEEQTSFTEQNAENAVSILESDEAKEELAEIVNINDSSLSIEVDEDNSISQIYGLLSEETADSSGKVEEILENLSELIGIKNFDNELRFEETTDCMCYTKYIFKQYYKGIELTNSDVFVLVNKATGEAEYLNSSFIPDFSIDTDPKINSKKAKKILKKEIGECELGDPELVIYSGNEGERSLAWSINVELLDVKAYIDAVSGELINKNLQFSQLLSEERALTMTIPRKKNSFLNDILPLSMSSAMMSFARVYEDGKETNKYRLRDVDRNISIIDDLGFYVSSTGMNSVAYTFSPYSKTMEDTFTSSNLTKHPWLGTTESGSSEELGLVALYNTAKAYDFYYNNFNHKGFDRNMTYNSRTSSCPNILVVPDARYSSDGTGRTLEPWSNAMGGTNVLCFGEGSGNTKFFAADPDVVVHEFTHSVTNKLVGWNCAGNIEASCLNEAYSDIMGELAEDEPDWKVATYVYVDNQYAGRNTSSKICMRNLKDPKNCIDGSQYLCKYPGKTQMNNANPYTGSTIISSTAYLMTELVTSKDFAAKIWFQSLSFYDSNSPTFSDCRKAVIKSAEVLAARDGWSSDEISSLTKRIGMVFDAVNVK